MLREERLLSSHFSGPLRQRSLGATRVQSAGETNTNAREAQRVKGGRCRKGRPGHDSMALGWPSVAPGSLFISRAIIGSPARPPPPTNKQGKGLVKNGWVRGLMLAGRACPPPGLPPGPPSPPASPAAAKKLVRRGGPRVGGRT